MPEAKRTKMQSEANQVDMDLYRLIGRAEALAAGKSLDVVKRDVWAEIAGDLRAVRPSVRAWMNEADRRATPL